MMVPASAALFQRILLPARPAASLAIATILAGSRLPGLTSQLPPTQVTASSANQSGAFA